MTRTESIQPELLSPAGQWPALRAAVANGADAVYFGLEDFNARRRADNFTTAELPAVMDYLHGHNVRGYVAMNTLVFSDELDRAAQFVQAAAAAGADALIVQDLGLAALARRLAPTLALHASTQMTQSGAAGVEALRALGISRVILARELSLEQIAALAAETDIELEVFVHGAICISYSGQCLASEALLGRSANRGLCAQACRLPYEVVGPGAAPGRYPLSPRDLAAWDLLPQLLRAGVTGFKIEGRLKAATYVAAATGVYRAALDAALAGKPFTLSPAQETQLQQSFSRGFTHGFLEGGGRALVDGRWGKSRGVEAGTVVEKTAASVTVQLPPGQGVEFLQPGDGVAFGAEDEAAVQGGRIYYVTPCGRPHGLPPDARCVLLKFDKNAVNLAAIPLGCPVVKTDDPKLRAQLEATFARDEVVRRCPLHVRVEGSPGAPLTIELRDDRGHAARVTWEGPLLPAREHPLSEELVRKQFGRLGQTPFALTTVEFAGGSPPPVMAPMSVLNNLRRQGVEQLLSLRKAQAVHAVADSLALDHLRAAAPSAAAPAAASPALCVLVRSMEQLRAVLEWTAPEGLSRPAMVYLDLPDATECASAVAAARAAAMPVAPATLRILTPGQEPTLAALCDLAPDALLVRNLTAIRFVQSRGLAIPMIGDFSLNAVNELSAAWLSQQGLARVTAGYDLDMAQLSAMAGRIKPALLEVVAHQHMPLFHTQYGFCTGPSRLKDRMNIEHPVFLDGAGRCTVYNAHVQSAAFFAADMLALGLRNFRVELLDETPEQAGQLLEVYAHLLAGHVSGDDAWRRLQELHPEGLTRGTLAVK